MRGKSAGATWKWRGELIKLISSSHRIEATSLTCPHKRTHDTGAVTELVLSGAVQYAVKEYTSIHFLPYTLMGIFSCFLIGYIVSMILSARERTIVSALVSFIIARIVFFGRTPGQPPHFHRIR
jgi:hypothetical protein